MVDGPGESREKGSSRVKSSPSAGSNSPQKCLDDKTLSTKDDSSLASLNLKYNIRSKSTLGSVLIDYGLPEEKKKRHKKREPDTKVRPPQRRRRETYEDERDRERRLYREKKSQQVVDDLDSLKDHYYAKYMNMLNERVKKQHVDFKRRSEDQQRQLQEEKETASHRVKKRLTRSDLSTDNSFMKDLHKSQFHEILARERKLAKEGKLKTLTDSELFWSKELNIPTSIKDDSQRRGIQNNLLSMLGGDSSENFSFTDQDSINSLDDTQQPATNLNLYQIEEVSESRPSTREQQTGRWAVTQQAQHIYKPTRDKERRRGSMNSQARKTKDEVEIQFPRVEMPKLHCFTMSLAKPPPDLVEERRKADLANRERERRVFLRKIQKMYQLAMANTASANRILDKHDPDDLFLLMEGPNVSDKTSHYALKPSPFHDEANIDHFFLTHTDQSWPPGKYGIATIPEERESEVQTRQSFITHQTHTEEITDRTGSGVSAPSSKTWQMRPEESEARSKPMPIISREKSIPLTMNELLEQCPEEKIMEAKQLSSLWTNYMKENKPMAVNT
ncbi:uncharacterized protein LOC135487406 isoform X2 [Lineus longissimus]|uniref:uncharacterized protein LOC135487406 isoform X2 n=1 Tax=Lineus longissimus TaxID=88925 RepID=UPI002B4CDE3F